MNANELMISCYKQISVACPTDDRTSTTTLQSQSNEISHSRYNIIVSVIFLKGWHGLNYSRLFPFPKLCCNSRKCDTSHLLSEWITYDSRFDRWHIICTAAPIAARGFHIIKTLFRSSNRCINHLLKEEAWLIGTSALLLLVHVGGKHSEKSQKDIYVLSTNDARPAEGLAHLA